MKNLIILVRSCVVLAATFNIGFAQDCGCSSRGFTVSVISPSDVFCGVGGYLCNVGRTVVSGGRTVVSGAGKIITAPFKSEFVFPRVRRYRYVPGRIYRQYDTTLDQHPPYAGPFPTQYPQ
jgi:hypothetical protein